MVKNAAPPRSMEISEIANQAISHLDDVSGYLSCGASSMEDLVVILGAIRDALPENSSTYRLAHLGARLAEEGFYEFSAYTKECNRALRRLNNEVRR